MREFTARCGQWCHPSRRLTSSAGDDWHRASGAGWGGHAPTRRHTPQNAEGPSSMLESFFQRPLLVFLTAAAWISATANPERFWRDAASDKEWFIVLFRAVTWQQRPSRGSNQRIASEFIRKTTATENHCTLASDWLLLLLLHVSLHALIPYLKQTIVNSEVGDQQMWQQYSYTVLKPKDGYLCKTYSVAKCKSYESPSWLNVRWENSHSELHHSYFFFTVYTMYT